MLPERREYPIMKIVVLDGHTLNPGDLDWSGLEALGEVTVYDRTGTDESLIVERATDAEIVLTNKTPLSANVIGQLPDLRYIGELATGYNNVDVRAAADRGIPVTNIPTYGTDSVAEMTFAHILELARRVTAHAAHVSTGGWARSVDFCYWLHPQIELAGKTIGIVGFGTIGRRVAEIARAFRMRVVANSRSRRAPPDWEGFAWLDIDELLAASDVVSLHCPLTAETEGMINAKRLRLMKPTALLINMARGPVVVDADLAAALHEGTVAGAGLDVLDPEPPAPDNPLYRAPNCIITPHIAWATHEARSRLLNTAVDNVKGFLDGSPQNVVNGV
jgi:glycerate dehydrogenase